MPVVDDAGSLEILGATPGVVRALTGYLTDEQWRWRPAPDSWSVLEVVAHLRDIEREVYGALLQRVLREDAPTMTGHFDASGWARDRRYNDFDPAVTLAEFTGARAGTVEALRAAPSDAVHRTWRDREGTTLTLGVLLHRFANHDAIHLGQIAKCKRAQRAY
jgi:hypothetical protein